MTEREIAIREAVEAHPTANVLFRLPVIRHIRAAIATHRVNRHYAVWERLGALPEAPDSYSKYHHERYGR